MKIKYKGRRYEERQREKKKEVKNQTKSCNNEKKWIMGINIYTNKWTDKYIDE